MAIEEREILCQSCGETFSYLRAKKSGGRSREFCDGCITKRQGLAGMRKATIALSPGDWELLDEVKRKLGIDTSEAIRTCIRVYGALLKR